MRWRPVALPPEHGGWGLLFEPILIGLIAAPSIPGLFVALAAIAAFLVRHPLKLVATDLLAGRSVPRMRDALGFAIGYGLLATSFGAAALWTSRSGLLIVLACCAPLAAVSVAYDARNRSREVLPEICAAAALAASAWAIGMAADWPMRLALPLWAVAAGRTVPAMVTVRTRVRRLHGAPASAAPPFAVHTANIAASYVLQRAGIVPTTVPLVFVALALRALITLRPSTVRVRAQRIGVEELVVGLVAALALGWGLRR